MRAQSGGRPVPGTRWRWITISLYVSLAIVLAQVAWAATADGPYQIPPAVGLSFTVYLVTGIAFAIRASRHRSLDRRSRRAWGLMAAGYAVLTASNYLRSLYPVGSDFPSPADLLRLLFVPVLLAGLLALPLRGQAPRERHKVWLDTSIVLIASTMLMWFVQSGPGGSATSVSGGALAAAIAYPVSDLVLIFGSCIVLLRGGADAARRPAALLGAAMLSLAMGDVMLSYAVSRTGGADSAAWQFACWSIAHFLLTMAPVSQCRNAGQHALRTEESRARIVSNLPYLAIAVGYAVLLSSVIELPAQVIGLVLAAGAMTAVVVIRQIVAMRENHELAITDTLTGLGNRRQFYETLRGTLARSARGGKTVAALLIDMNGFKHVNDTMGHDAGDRLLVAFGRLLRRNVLGLDAVGRLGGDEFAIVLHDVGTLNNAEAVVRRLLADMENPVLIGDTPIQPRASIGLALSAPGHLTADELLNHADEAMYSAKALSRQTGDSGFAHYEPRPATPVGKGG